MNKYVLLDPHGIEIIDTVAANTEKQAVEIFKTGCDALKGCHVVSKTSDEREIIL